MQTFYTEHLYIYIELNIKVRTVLYIQSCIYAYLYMQQYAEQSLSLYIYVYINTHIYPFSLCSILHGLVEQCKANTELNIYIESLVMYTKLHRAVCNVSFGTLVVYSFICFFYMELLYADLCIYLHLQTQIYCISSQFMLNFAQPCRVRQSIVLSVFP